MQRFNASRLCPAVPRAPDSTTFLSVVLAALLLPAFLFSADRSPAEKRKRAASRFVAYDFEPRGNSIRSRDRDYDGKPDYWQVQPGPMTPFEARDIRIVPDRWRLDHTGYPPGHVLRIPFSGRRIGMQTLYPKIVDPQLAYEITAFVRTEGLDQSIVAIDIVWLQVDEEGNEKVLGGLDRLIAPRGQRDWTEGPLRRRINELPPEATHVRIICSIEDDPSRPGADRHGVAWFDDIRVESRPKIEIPSIFRDDRAPLTTSITYQGLLPNAAGEGEELARKVYSRRLEVRDVHGEPVPLPADMPFHRELNPGRATTYTEDLQLSTPRRGVYYVNVRLYGADEQPRASVTQVVGRWPPPRRREDLKREPQAADQFGIGFDLLAVRDRVKTDSVANALRHSGVFRARIELFKPRTQEIKAEKALWGLPELLRGLRADGMRFTGVFGRLPETIADDAGILNVMARRPERLKEATMPAILQLHAQMDDWQWGGSRDPGFSAKVDPEVVQPLRSHLQDLTSAIVQALPVRLDRVETLPPLEAADAISIHVPAGMGENRMVGRLADLALHKFAPMVAWEPEIFPSEPLEKLASHAATRLERMPVPLDGEDGPRPLWLGIETQTVDPYLREQRRERDQAIDMARKLILGRVAGMDRIYVGDLLDPFRGLAAVTRHGDVVPRPALLALRTIAEELSMATYIGSFQLEDPEVVNYVFRRQGPQEEMEEAVLAMWYVGSERDVDVQLGPGMGRNLKSVDLSGNRIDVTGSRFTVGKMPQFVTGLSVPMCQTRMSIQILDDPPLLSRSERQYQRLRIRNFFKESLVGTIRLVYALDRDRRFEPGWSRPDILRIALPPGGEERGKRTEIRERFEVRPSDESILGRKFILADATLAAVTEARFRSIRSSELTSELKPPEEFRVVPSPDPNERVIRLSLEWKPNPKYPHPPRLELRPFYHRAGDQPTYLSPMIVYPNTYPAVRDIRIPRFANVARIWIGAEEEGGNRFVRREVTDLVFPPVE